MICKVHLLALGLVVGMLGCKTKGGAASSDLTATSDPCLPTQSSGASAHGKGPRFGEGVPSAQALRAIGVNDSEVKAVQEYTSNTNSASFIREILQGIDAQEAKLYKNLMGKNYLDIAEHFRTGITKISEKSPYRGPVWRGIVVVEKNIDELSTAFKHKKPIGLYLDQERAYVSTTRSKDFAMMWADRVLAQEQKKLGDNIRDKKLIYEIKQCRGAPIETIEPLARGMSQLEVIMPPSSYLITDMKQYGSNTVGVFLQEVGCHSASLTENPADFLGEPQGLGLTETVDQADLADQDDPILSHFDFDVSAANDDQGSGLTDLEPTANLSSDTGLNLTGASQAAGFALAGNKVCADPRLKEKFKTEFMKLDGAATQVKKAQRAYNTAANAADQNAARAALKAAQARATETAKGFASAIKVMRPVRVASGALKMVPVVGYLAEGAALGMGIAEAVQVKKSGGSDSAAAAAVLSGFGMAGAIPAILACQDCTPDEKAAAFFSGFFGIDFSSLVICPGKRCPQDQDLAGFNGDWSINRVKRSCPKGVPLAGTSHDTTEINAICTSIRPLPVTQYHYADNGNWEKRWSYDLKCDSNEYLAGISFLTSRGTPTYGIKSILCARSSRGLSNSCTEVAAESCPSHQFLRGIFLDRAHRSKGNIGTLCSKAVGQGRDDDQLEYCDHVKSVWCCNIPPGI